MDSNKSAYVRLKHDLLTFVEKAKTVGDKKVPLHMRSYNSLLGGQPE